MHYFLVFLIDQRNRRGHMDLQLAQQRFWEEGYLVLENFFESELMDELHEHILDHFNGAVESVLNDEFKERSQSEIVPWFPQREFIEAFDKIDAIQEFTDLTGAILGQDWNNLYSMVMFSARGTCGQAWHQDCPPEDKSRFNLNRLIYTADITPEIGGQIMVVPRTHKGGALPAGEPDVDFEGQLEFFPRKGTLILLHGHTWHRVMPVAGAYRVSTNYRAAPANIPAEVTDVCVYRNMRYQFSINQVIEERIPAATKS